MTQLTEEHFELHDQNKAERYERQKIKFLEDRIKTLETAIESHAKILARFQMTEGAKIMSNFSWCHGPTCHGPTTHKIEYVVSRVARS